MKQPAKQNEETRVVGLASENKLPDAFKARTNEDAGTVELRKPNHRGVDVSIAGYQAAANLLGTFAEDGEPSLDPGATITIIDNFSGKSTTITASTFVDVAAVFHAFVVRKGRYKPQTETPAEDEPAAQPQRKAPRPKRAAAPARQEHVAAAPATEASPKSEAPTPVEAPAPEAPKAGRTTSGKSAAATKPANAAKPAVQAVKKAAPASKKQPVKVEPARTEPKTPATPAAQAPKAAADGRKGSLAGFPEWARKSLKAEYGDATWDFKLLATKVSLDKENGKNVLGPDDGKAEHHGFGYEVLIHGKHAAWVIAEAENAFHLTGVDGYETTRHRNIDPAVYIRIRRVIYPLLGHAAPEGL
jgi:hypothetical protein